MVQIGQSQHSRSVEEKRKGRKTRNTGGGQDGISILQISPERRMSGSLKQSHLHSRWIHLIKGCTLVSLAKKFTCHIKKKLSFRNGKPLSWGLKDKLMKSGTKILVAKDLSIIHVCVHMCIHACTHTQVDHRAPLCTLGKGAPSRQKQSQGTLVVRQTVGWL